MGLDFNRGEAVCVGVGEVEGSSRGMSINKGIEQKGHGCHCHLGPVTECAYCDLPTRPEGIYTLDSKLKWTS